MSETLRTENTRLREALLYASNRAHNAEHIEGEPQIINDSETWGKCRMSVCAIDRALAATEPKP